MAMMELKHMLNRMADLFKKTRRFLLWAPLVVFSLGTAISIVVYLGIKKRETEVHRRESLQRAQNTINKIDLLISNSLLRVQSYEDYLGTRWIDYESETPFLKAALSHTIFEQLSVYRQRGKVIKNPPNLKRILKVEVNLTAPPAGGPLGVIESKELLSSIQDMLEQKDYQRAVIYEEGDSRMSVVLRSRARDNILFVFTVPLAKLFEKAEIRPTENIVLTDLRSNARWNITRGKNGVDVLAEAKDKDHPAFNPTVRADYSFLFSDGLPQSGISIGFDFNLDNSVLPVSTAVISLVSSLLITIVLSCLFWVLISRNRSVTRLAIERSTDLEKARHEAGEALLARTRFIGNISHEIRTPLNLILGMIDLCEEKDVDRKIQDYLRSMRASGNHLLAMIEDLIDLAKSESNEIHIQNKIINLTQFVDEVSRIAGRDSAKKNLQMYTILGDNLPSSVQCDPSRLRQILLNLLKNAFKYTNHGFVSLKVTADDSKTQGFKRIQFEVRDTGIGIPEDKIGRVFDAFFQLETAAVLSEGGVGLGLSIVRELVRKLKGNVEVSSHPGKGSVFLVTLDLEVADETPWYERYRSPEDGVKYLMLVSSDPLWLDSMKSLEKHPNLKTEVLPPNLFQSYLSKHPENPLQWFILDAESLSLAVAELPPLLGPRKSIIAGDKRRLMDQNENLQIPVVDRTPTIVSEILALAGLPLRKRPKEKETSTEDIREATVSSAETLNQSLSLIVADDDAGNRELYKAYFEKSRWDVSYTEDGVEAWDAYLQHRPDMMILDVRMPNLDGFGVLEKLRAHESRNNLPELPVLLVTADALEQTAARARGLKKVTLLTKPIRKAKLLESMHQARL